MGRAETGRQTGGYEGGSATSEPTGGLTGAARHNAARLLGGEKTHSRGAPNLIPDKGGRLRPDLGGRPKNNPKKGGKKN